MHINERIRRARESMRHPHKSSGVSAGPKQYRFAPLNAVLDAVLVACNEHGLTVTQSATTTTDGWERVEKQGKYGVTFDFVARGCVNVTTTVRADDGASVDLGPYSCPWFGGSQDVGIATTYARRYALLTAFGLYGEDDSDGLTIAEQAEAAITHREAEARKRDVQRRPAPDACSLALRGAGCKTAGDAEAVSMYLMRNPTPSAAEDREALARAVEQWVAEHPGVDLVKTARDWSRKEGA